MEKTSLAEKLSGNLSSLIFRFIWLTIIIVFILFYVQCRSIFNSQVEIWNTVFPQSTISYLIDSDYFSVSKETSFLGSTGLFSSITITDNKKRIISDFGKKSSLKNLTPIKDEANIVWGYYELDAEFIKYFSPYLLLWLAIVLVVSSLYFLVNRFISRLLNIEFNNLKIFLDELDSLANTINKTITSGNSIDFKNSFSKYAEQNRINDIFNKLFQELRIATNALRESEFKSEKQKFREELTKKFLQVMHNADSPLASIQTIVHVNSALLSEATRIQLNGSIGTLRQLVGSLFEKARIKSPNFIGENELKENHLLHVISQIVSEKQVEYIDRKNIRIIFNIDMDSYGLFSFIRTGDFSSTISNIINNSVEAIKDSGDIIISLKKEDGSAKITISDEGVGMSSDVLKKIGKYGFTQGKKSGNGLGLYHAFETVDNFGGSISIDSSPGNGTLVSILVPLITPPSWHASELNLSHYSSVIVIDDDKAIHEVWAQKISSLDPALKSEIKLIHLYSPLELENLVLSGDFLEGDVVFLCDYNFIGSSENGLDLITRLKIKCFSILVTSSPDLPSLINKCLEEGIKLLPKDIAYLMPITMNA